jgi:hypothetical protein
VNANDQGVATRVFRPDAPAAALGPGSGPAVTFATTEHFNLQTARALTVSEANGRASIYLAALSSNLFALAFIGQMSRLGVAFHAFALDAYSPEAVDRAAMSVSPSQPAGAA